MKDLHAASNSLDFKDVILHALSCGGKAVDWHANRSITEVRSIIGSDKGEISMQSKSILTGMVVAVLTLFVAGGVVEAKKGKGGSNGSTDTRFEADLEPFNIPGPNAEGNSERRTKTKNNAIKDDRFKATVEIPIPNGLGIDENNARSQDIRLILTDELGGFIAECQLVFDDIEQDLTTGQLEAEYKLDLRAKKRGKGSCEGIVNNSGLPDVVRGDVAIATLVTNPSDRTQDIELLQGTYDQH